MRWPLAGMHLIVRKVGMSVSAPEAINYIHVMLNLYNQPAEQVCCVLKRNEGSLHGRGLCNKARHDRNQSNKAMLAP